MFEILFSSDYKRARVGLLRTAHGEIKTPIFIPVATAGAIKGVPNNILEEIGVEIILANTYHLYLRPGLEVIREFGGLHNFIGWQKPILTDSGGFQIFSMSQLRKVQNEGIQFQSHIDGSSHFLSPESAIEAQEIFNSDIMMVLDECLPYPSSYNDAKRSVELTISWAERCKKVHSKKELLLFGIIQGGTYKDLRRYCIEKLLEIDFRGYAIGGLSVGEPEELLLEIVEFCLERFPRSKPVYLMGSGTPPDIIKAVALGVDMFDCVLPTRNARNGCLFTSKGKIIIKHEKYKYDHSPIDENCCCYTCKNFSKAYLRHLFLSKEYNSYILNSIHNLFFYINLMRMIRESIMNKEFEKFAKDFLNQYECEDLNERDMEE